MIFLVVMVTGGQTASVTDSTVRVTKLKGGQTKGNAPLTSVELLSTEGARLCSLPDLPKARRHHSQTGLVACAGYGDSLFAKETLKSCVTLKSGRWQKSHTLRTVSTTPLRFQCYYFKVLSKKVVILNEIQGVYINCQTLMSLL